MYFIKGILIFFSSLLLTLLPQKTYREGMVGQPVSFLPNEVQSENDQIVSKLIFRGLFTYNKNGELVNDLADSYQISDDGLSYTVLIKKNQRWSNGSEITADDLLYTAFKTPALSEIATDKIDKYTIRYTLPNKFSPFLSVLTIGVFPSITANNQLSPISSGPYKVVRVKREGPAIREVVLQKIAKDYSIPRVTFRYYADSAQLVTAAQLGEIKGFVSTKDVEIKNFNKKVYSQGGIYYYLAFNLRNGKLNNLDIRKKLLSATPIVKIARENGLKTDGPISENPYARKDLSYDTYNPDAKGDLKLSLTLTVSDLKEHVKTAEIIKEAWKNMGVDVTFRTLPLANIENDIIPKRDFDVLLFGQEVSRDPDRYALWHSTRINDPGLNLAGFENVRSDRALEEGRKFLDFAERKKQYDVFQQVMFDNIPAIFLYHPPLKFYVSKKVKVADPPSIYYNHDRFLDFKDWDIL